MADEKLNVQLGAETGELKSGMSEAESTVNTATTQMKAGFEAMAELTKAATKGMKGAIESCLDLVSTAFPEIGVAIQGIKIAMEAAMEVWDGIKKAIANTVSWNTESMKMASTLGVTNQAASGLAATLNHIGISQETFSKATNAMTGQLGSNEQAFKDLEIKTRDVNGNYRSMTDIMLDANKALAEITAGTEREIAGKKIYGDAWNEVRSIINLTSAEMVLGKEKAHDLGLEVSEEGAQATKKYTAEMRDMNAGMTAFNKVIGDAVMPLLGKLAEYFNNVLPTAVTIFKAAVNSVVVTLDFVGYFINIFWVVAKAMFLSIAVAIADTGIALKRLVTGDFAGAANAMKDIGRDISLAWKMSSEELQNDTEAFAKRLNNLMDLGPKAKAKTPEGNHLKHGSDAKAKHGDKEEHSGGAKVGHGKGSKGGGSAEKSRMAEWEKELEKQKMKKKEYFKESEDAELTYAAVQDKVKEIEKKRAEEAIKQANKVLEHKIKMVAEDTQIAQDAIKQKLAMGQISQEEEYQLQAALLNKEFELTQKYKKEEAENLKGDLKAKKDVLDQIELLRKQHDRNMQKLSNQVVLEQRKDWKALADGIKSSFGGAIKGMITGATTFQQAMQQMSKQVLGLVMEMGIKMLQSTIKNVWASVFAHQAGEAAKTTSTEEGSLKRMAANLKDTIKQINNAAVSAAAGAYNAMVGIPYVGPVLGAIAAGVTYTAVLAFGAMASAAGGYEIPSGVNPVTQLHQDEMVLPADLSSGLKNIIRSGQTGDGMGGSNGTHVHMHVNTLDAKGVKSFMKANKAAVASAAVAHMRNMGSLTPARGTR